MSSEPHHYDEPSSSTIYSDLHVGDTTQVASELENATYLDEEEEHCSTGYSEFCDDDVIWAASDINYDPVDSSPTVLSPATTPSKRKSPEDSEPSSSLYASYKRQTVSRDSTISEPYIIVGFVRVSESSEHS